MKKIGRATLAFAALAAGLAMGACQDHEFHPPDSEERVALADSAYAPAAFDTLTWASEAERIEAGNLVYADECRRCHGALGKGETEYSQAQELDVPSLVAEDWGPGNDLDAVRRLVFTGHAEGMPSWGLHKLEPRQIDAVAYYILEQLRPEVLQSQTVLPGG